MGAPPRWLFPVEAQRMTGFPVLCADPPNCCEFHYITHTPEAWQIRAKVSAAETGGP